MKETETPQRKAARIRDQTIHKVGTEAAVSLLEVQEEQKGFAMGNFIDFEGAFSIRREDMKTSDH